MSIFMRGISSTELDAVLRMDANVVSTDLKKYVKANHDVYTIIGNTWLLMCEEVCGSVAARVLKNSLLMHGLLATIKECDRIANLAIQSDFTATPDSPLRALFTEDVRLTLQVLRYPKRFSPFEADKVRAESIAEFLKINTSLKGVPLRIDDEGHVIERTKYYPDWLIKSVREYCQLMLGNPRITDEDINLAGEFSNGMSGDIPGAKVLADKVIHYSVYCPYYKHYTYPLGCGVVDEPLDHVRVVAVPKSYKAARIIAEVPAYQQFHMQGIRKLMINATQRSDYRDLIVLDDQRINQEWSRLGAVYGCYATIDLSAASDSISENLAKQVLPREWYNAIARWNPTRLLVNGKIYPRYIFQTSGNGTTFIGESVIFLAIALTATELVRVFTQEWIADPRVYGDDIICDDRVYDTLVDLLGLLDFKVNLTKSFTGTSRYRESCGAEWFCGLDTATRYFPRSQMDVKEPEGLQALISLQHRLFEFKTVDDWLVVEVRRIARANFHIEMTSSFPGSDCDDLWEDFPLYKVINPPFDHGKRDAAPDGIRREGHYALAPKAVTVKHPLASERVTDIIRYVDFLQHGPSYESPLDELLGVSMKRSVTPEYEVVPSEWRIVK